MVACDNLLSPNLMVGMSHNVRVQFNVDLLLHKHTVLLV